MKELKEFLKSLDLSDIRLLMLGCVFLIIPLAYFFFLSKSDEVIKQNRKYSLSNVSRQSAFNLTSNKKSSSAAARVKKPSGFSEGQRAEKIEAELGSAWTKIQKIPKKHNYPANLPPDTKLMLDAEEDEILVEGNILLDSGDFFAAEKVFLKAVKNAGSNEFRELYAYGGLMEVYQMTGNVVKFREAFGNYARVAQKLKRVYGPLADNIARAHQMFEQLAQADPAKIREHLARHNLKNGTKVTYDQFSASMKHTQEWFPGNLPEPEPKLPSYLNRGYDG